MRLSECAQRLNGELSGDDRVFGSASIDTRTLQPGDLYIAIAGERFDGNEFVAQAAQSGAVAAVVRQGVKADIPTIEVADTRLALAELGGVWRSRANAKVVGVTGSNGKTTVKEMVAAVLGTGGEVLYTKGNLNNDIGVPLTLLRLAERHRYAVIEMGANHPGEIAYTAAYAKPDVAIITNAGPAHIEGFGSVEGVARAKGELFAALRPDGVAIINRDDAFFGYWQSVASPRRILSFGLSDGSEVSASDIKTEIIEGRFATGFTLSAPAGQIRCRLQLAGRHNVLNALAAAAAGLALGLNPEQIAQGLQSVKPVTGRLQPWVGRKGNIVIDDTYNANAGSLKAGLDVLAGIGKKPWLVLGAFAELGPESLNMHRDMGTLIKSSGVVRLLATGSDAGAAVEAFGKGASFYETQEALIAALESELTGDETVLIKGSRMRRMENVAAALVENFRA
ncbi:UDP-N-acetylmuramoyl-tripeptide--D-alanyl-D-alanine ligase [Methylomicrobium sp. RS1]|jgi:UDP-N-acetylmuramoyl-tripeptide--D-alanyl-D-alanine ligase|uniref:UDP-N-acetylmuramoyl-tripeptide--D-alanyl-D- alanine ligase n=1 Tax=Candidatus Methylomicrobium oryzae TaxID=2802053 RepID=UPI0019240353|nr:UDP-N-acetylmuramoyl-tripeptide--D-alanyl-D-alanine ligase [Methylomicrobium sp. RS1]MBL1263166.1 UDP-N-acetylmuramoyl-tripeptide--D-alanyl-D-alanine ligase [Methylomicrobium sp. RS1]